jgi:hypothetical protein
LGWHCANRPKRRKRRWAGLEKERKGRGFELLNLYDFQNLTQTNKKPFNQKYDAQALVASKLLK